MTGIDWSAIIPMVWMVVGVIIVIGVLFASWSPWLLLIPFAPLIILTAYASVVITAWLADVAKMQ
jgi:hypothetical protein